MPFNECVLLYAHSHGYEETPNCIGFVPDVLLEVQSKVAANSYTGVSTQYALFMKKSECGQETIQMFRKEDNNPHWYVLRTTYGREKKAYDYMTAKGVHALYPTRKVVKLVNGKLRTVIESLIPNIFFAYGTKELLMSFVYDNVNLPYLRFYYRHIHNGNNIKKVPMIIPDCQLDSLRIISNIETDNAIVSFVDIPKFNKGQLVRVVDGAFKGVIGRVARYQGQQRVGVVVDDLITVCTAYIPSAFLVTL